LKRGTFGNEGESDRGELQKARTRKESSAAEEKRRKVTDGGDFGGERTTDEMTG
jgi:hypothetical protein